MTMDTPSSTALPKRKLPFKRTAPRANAQTPTTNLDRKQDDYSEFFRRDRRHFFEEQERQSARRKAQREKERKAKSADGGINSTSEVEKQFCGDSEEAKSPSIPNNRSGGSESHDAKRRRLSLPDDDDDAFTPSRAQKPSNATSNSPTTSAKSVTKSKLKHESTGSTQTRAKPSTLPAEVISLSSSDEDDVTFTTPSSSKGKEKMRYEMAAEDRKSTMLQPDSDIEEIDEPEEEDELTKKYYQEAIARMEAAKAEAEARKAKEGDSAVSEPAVDVLVVPRMQQLQPLKLRLLVSQKFGYAKTRWAMAQCKKNPELREDMFRDVFFTWKENKLYDHTTLLSLGIKPDAAGRLYPAWENSREGYHAWDKVLVEAWTPEIFEQFVRDKELERKRALGELDDEDMDDDSSPEPVRKKHPSLKVVLKSKEKTDTVLTVQPDVHIRLLIKAFRQKRKVPDDKEIQILWDGEVLDPDTTIADAGMEDMDSVDVYVT